MAQIRMPEINPINYGQANSLLAAGQGLIGQGITGLQGALTDYRNSIVNRNTANAVGLLTGAQDLNDLKARQGQVASLLQQAGGDIDAQAINKAQLAMPDTLMSRQNTSNQLKDYDIKQHDQPIVNAAMTRYLAGDIEGANTLLSGLQGDASSALTFGAGRQDAANAERDRQAQLAISREGLNLRKQAAARAGAGNKQLAALYEKLLKPGNDAALEQNTAVTNEQVERAAADEKNNVLNNPKNDPTKVVSELNDQSKPWYSWPVNALAYTSPLRVGTSIANGTDIPFVKGELGNKVQNLAEKIPGYNDLDSGQKSVLLQRMGEEYDKADTLTGNKNPEKVATDWATSTISDLNKSRTARLGAKNAQITNKQRIREQNLQMLLPLMLQGNPQALLQYQNLLDEE